MRGIVVREFGPLGTASLEELPSPEPGSNEVRVDIQAVAANFVDILVMEGRYQFLPARPFVPGKGPAGIVSAIGQDVASLKVGDRVLAMCEHGGYAEEVCAAAEQCYLLPTALSFEEAAAISLSFDTAWMALLERGRLQGGETVLVLGSTGAVGSAAVQLARARGAVVIAAVSSQAKAWLARESGADHIVDLSRENLRDSLREQVYAVTNGRGADVIIDTLGGDVFDAAIRALAWRGRLVIVGFAAGRIATLKTNYLLLKNIEVSGLQISDYRKRVPELMRRCFDDIFRLYEEGKIKSAPRLTYPLAHYVDALSGVRDRKVSGRAILLPHT